jgi:hypothetical protein
MAKIVSRGNVVVELDEEEFRDLMNLLSGLSPAAVKEIVGDYYDTLDGSLERLHSVLNNARSDRDV